MAPCVECVFILGSDCLIPHEVFAWRILDAQGEFCAVSMARTCGKQSR